VVRALLFWRWPVVAAEQGRGAKGGELCSRAFEATNRRAGTLRATRLPKPFRLRWGGAGTSKNGTSRAKGQVPDRLGSQLKTKHIRSY